LLKKVTNAKMSVDLFVPAFTFLRIDRRLRWVMKRMKIDTAFLTRTALMAALAVAFQSLGLQQFITGPVINAVLYTSVGLVGTLSGVLVGLITPWVALVTGILKFPPVVPVVIAGNLTLALVFGILKRTNTYLAALAAAVAKYVVMTAGIKILLAQQVPLKPPVIASMTVVQLYTALGGAVISLIAMRSLQVFKPRRHGDSQG